MLYWTQNVVHSAQKQFEMMLFIKLNIRMHENKSKISNLSTDVQQKLSLNHLRKLALVLDGMQLKQHSDGNPGFPSLIQQISGQLFIWLLLQLLIRPRYLFFQPLTQVHTLF